MSRREPITPESLCVALNRATSLRLVPRDMAIGIDDAALQAQVQEVFARFNVLEIEEMRWYWSTGLSVATPRRF